MRTNMNSMGFSSEGVLSLTEGGEAMNMSYCIGPNVAICDTGGGPPLGTWLGMALMLLLAGLALAFVPEVMAQARIPGADASDKLEAAGTLLRLVDTALFKWGARIFAGICIFSSAWSLKEQRFGTAVICIIGAIIFGTAPTWVKNIFDIGGGGGIFAQVSAVLEAHV